MAYDPVDGYVVLFGGYNFLGRSHTSAPFYYNDTWKFSAGTWSKISTKSAPSPRAGAGFTYDVADGYMLLVGGESSTAPYNLNDTWKFVGGQWARVGAIGLPSLSVLPELVYDPQDGFVLATFLNGSSLTTASTWSYLAGTWKDLHLSLNPPVDGASLAYDQRDGYAVLFGGVTANGPIFSNQTWEFTNKSWKNISGSVGISPPGRWFGAATYDNGTGRIIVVGGFEANRTGFQFVDNDVWAFSGGKWTNLTTVPGPSSRVTANLAFDSKDGYNVLYGGTQEDPYKGVFVFLGDTWSLKGAKWAKVLPVAPSGRYSPALTFDSVDNVSILFGGATPNRTLGDTWEFRHSAWVKLGGTSPTGREGAVMAYDSHDRYVVLFGGENSNGFLNDTWKFVTGKWTRLTPNSTPPGRAFAAFSDNPTMGSLVLFGGNDGGPAADTWVFSGGQWSNLTGSTKQTPTARVGAGMSYDPGTKANVLFGGFNGGYLSDTWTFKNGSWSFRTPLNTPPARDFFGITYDPSLKATILFSGYNGTYLNDTWSYAGGQWTHLFPAISPPKRELAGMTFDPIEKRVLLFGGYDGIAIARVWEY
jgi:hypothetical protein